MNYAGFGSLCRPNDLDHSWCWPNPFHTETTRGHDFYRGREPLDILGWAIYMILYDFICNSPYAWWILY